MFPLLLRIPDLSELFYEKTQQISSDKKKVGVFTTSIEYKWDNNMHDYSPQDYHYHDKLFVPCYLY